MQMGNPQMEHMPPPQHQSWGPPQGVPPSGGGGPGYGPTPQYMPPPRQLDNYYPPAETFLISYSQRNDWIIQNYDCGILFWWLQELKIRKKGQGMSSKFFGNF